MGSHVGVRETDDVGGRWAYILSGDEVDATIAADHLNEPGTITTSKMNVTNAINQVKLWLLNPRGIF